MDNKIKSIYVTNLPLDLDMDDFKSLFTEFGPIERFDFPERSKQAICFVHFENADDAAKCLETIDGYLYHGKVLRAKYSDKNKKEQNKNKYNRPDQYRDRYRGQYSDDYNYRGRNRRDMPSNVRDRNRDYPDRSYPSNRDMNDYYQYKQGQNRQPMQQAFAFQAAPSILPTAMQMPVMAAPVQVIAHQQPMQMMRIVQPSQQIQVRQYQDHSGPRRNMQPIIRAIPPSQYIPSQAVYAVNDPDPYYDKYRGGRQKGNDQDKGSKYRQHYR